MREREREIERGNKEMLTDDSINVVFVEGIPVYLGEEHDDRKVACDGHAAALQLAAVAALELRALQGWVLGVEERGRVGVSYVS